MNEFRDYKRFYNADDPRRWGRLVMQEQATLTRRWLTELGELGRDPVVMELGCGMGALKDVHPKHIGVEFSLAALRRVPKSSRLVGGDMQRLPFLDNSVDFIFSWAALEHVPHPEQVLAEVERVLRGGGICLFAPAWNVRAWAAKALAVRSYRELTFADRFRKATIPVRNTLVWRGLFAIPTRVRREIGLSMGQPLRFDYRRLSPNLTEYTYTDCDAFTSMDPHSAVLYYVSRGWRVLSHPTFLARFLARHEPVVVRKPA